MAKKECSCGHSWSTHNEFGCFSTHGHDEYCFCAHKPEHTLKKEYEYRLGQAPCYPCPEHKRYQIKRKPTGNCEKCWRMWIAVNP